MMRDSRGVSDREMHGAGLVSSVRGSTRPILPPEPATAVCRPARFAVRLAFCLAAVSASGMLTGCGDPKRRGPDPDRFVPIEERNLRGNDEIIDSLISDLTSGKPVRAWPAEEYLRRYGKEATPKLRPLLKHRELEVRAAAFRLLDAAGREEIIPDLIDLLMDEDQGLRYEAFLSLKRRTLQTFGYSHLADAETRARVHRRWKEWYEKLRKGAGEGAEEEGGR
ncbi:MAG: HEAT repeat domain-containing protein [Planctomycetota bacterium]|nr:HEAT repeat domain-containing protein [Planctomycetota bacterium]